MKNFYKIICTILLLMPCIAQAQCLPPTVFAGSISQTSAEIYLNGTTTGGTYYVEFGITGFTPGTAGTPGIGGTLVAVPTNQTFVNISGLFPNTTYSYFSRKNCSGVWSVNSTVSGSSGILHTAFDCNAAIPVVCNSMTNYNHANTYGAWQSANCSPYYQPTGTEVIYSFTPTISGNHKLYIPGTSSPAVYKYKTSGTGFCNEIGWTCIGYGPEMSSWLPPSQYTFGPLTAGTQYLILVDCLNWSAVQNTKFRIECPYCSEPTAVSASDIFPTSAKITWTNSTLQVLEYGPPGFIPGTGQAAGVNGTAVFIGGSDYTLTGLIPSTYYDVYLRKSCPGGTYSPNSNVIQFTTAGCPPATVYPNTPPSNYVGLNFYGNPGYYDHLGNCASGTPMPGEEQMLQFTSPSQGYFEMLVSTANFTSNYQVSFTQNCNFANAVCLYPVSSSNGIYTYALGPLNVGITYDIIFDVDFLGGPPFWQNIGVAINCPKPDFITASNVQPNQTTINWSCNYAITCQSPPLLEYGPEGFTPGTGATAGTNGTLISGAVPPYTITGLTPLTRYDVYMRSTCGGFYSTNTTKVTFKTAFNCSNAAVLSCGSYMQFSVGTSQLAIPGSWRSNACGNNNTTAPETVWQFTPTQSGTHSLYVYSLTASSTGYTYTANYYIKQTSLLCNEAAWSCVAVVSGNPTTFAPVYIPLGNLTAGVSYYIMADASQGTTHSFNYFSRVECPGICPGPNLTTVTTTATTATINGSCSGCPGSVKLEYGPTGFVPGTNSSPGAGGTLISVVTFPVTISGLTSGTTYDVYARNDCGLPLGYSPNSNVKTFTPCYTIPTGITSNVAGNTICFGNSITLTQSGGVLPVGGVFKWYSGNCGVTVVGTGNSITVSPTAGTIYRVAIESSCGNSTCAPGLTVYVNAPVATITPPGPISICTGGSVVLNASTAIGNTYVWKNGGVTISGATGATYTAIATGNYTVVVTNSGCSRTSPTTVVTLNLSPTVSFTGLAASYTNVSPTSTLIGSPSGGTFSGPGISGNTFNPSVAGVGGPYTITYSYTDGNGCSNTASQQTTVTGCTVPPAQPGTITTSGGASPVCPGESKSYSISAVPGAASYTWTAPVGGTVSSGQGTTNVTINYTAGFINPDTLRVVAVNNCGSSAQRKLSIQRNLPAIPGAITGEAYGLCNKSGVPYSVVAVAGITNNWSFNTGNATVSSGQGTSSITANYLSAFTTNAVLSVTASNGCGTSAPRTMTVRAVPATPGSITGALTVCANTSGVPYSITPVYGATTYTWVGPKKSHVSDGTTTSNNTTLVTSASSVTVNYGNSGGILKVRANNSCASSAYSSTNIVMNCRVSGQAEVNEIPEVLLFPNPAHDEINISISNYNEFEVEIMNMLGDRIHFSKNTTKIDLTIYPAGMYMMQITCGDYVVMEKFIVE